MRLLRLVLGLAATGCSAAALPAQDAPRRTPFSVGLAVGRYEYDAQGTGTANNAGVTVGFGRVPRWLDVEARLSYSRFAQQGFTSVVFFGQPTPFADGRRFLQKVHLEQQVALIAPWNGLRPYVGALFGSALIFGDRDGEFPLASSFGVTAGLRLQGPIGPNVGAGVRVRAFDTLGMFAGEFTFDVRVPIP